MTRNNGMNGIVTGIIIGGIVGSIVGMLYAPMKGKKLRKRIVTTTNDVLDDVNTYIETGKDRADDLLKVGRKRAESILQEAKNLVS